MGIDPLLAARNIITEQHIPIFTIGIGDASGSTLSYTDESGHVQYFYNEKGEKLKADIDETMLKNIANTTGGMYFHADTASNFSNIFSRLTPLVKTPESSSIVIRNFSLAPIIVCVLGCMMLIHMGIGRYIHKKYRF